MADYKLYIMNSSNVLAYSQCWKCQLGKWCKFLLFAFFWRGECSVYWDHLLESRLLEGCSLWIMGYWYSRPSRQNSNWSWWYELWVKLPPLHQVSSTYFSHNFLRSVIEAGKMRVQPIYKIFHSIRFLGVCNLIQWMYDFSELNCNWKN